jgi:hypothetical protein
MYDQFLLTKCKPTQAERGRMESLGEKREQQQNTLKRLKSAWGFMKEMSSRPGVRFSFDVRSQNNVFPSAYGVNDGQLKCDVILFFFL